MTSHRFTLPALALVVGLLGGVLAGCQAGDRRAAVDPEVAACQEWNGAIAAGGSAMMELSTAASLEAPDPVGSLMRAFIADADDGQVDPETMRPIAQRCAEIGVRLGTAA